MADPSSLNRKPAASAESAGEDAAPAAHSNQSVADYMEELIVRLNSNMGLSASDSKPLRSSDSKPVEPASPATESAGRKPAMELDEDAIRHSRPSGERLYDLAAVRREAGGPRCGLAAALAERMAIAYGRLAITVMALAGSFGLVQWGNTQGSRLGVLSGVVVLIVGLFWLYRYFRTVSQLAKVARKETAARPSTAAHGAPSSDARGMHAS